MRYSKPELYELNGGGSRGQCVDGTGATWDGNCSNGIGDAAGTCANGESPQNNSHCQTGVAPHYYCNAGQSPGDANCVSGTDLGNGNGCLVGTSAVGA